jgi:hypothetical protein
MTFGRERCLRIHHAVQFTYERVREWKQLVRSFFRIQSNIPDGEWVRVKGSSSSPFDLNWNRVVELLHSAEENRRQS